MNVTKQIKAGLAVLGVAVLGFPVLALAGSNQVVVTERDVARQAENTSPTKNWVIYTRNAATSVFRTGPASPPLNTGSLELTTPTGADKVTLFNFDHKGTKLSDVDNIAYSTYRSQGSDQVVASLNVVIDFNGPAVAGGFSTLVFEPVYNTAQGSVVSNQWQNWTAIGNGVWWSTRPINGQCAGATDACDKTWNEILANNPEATINASNGGVGINQGSGNPALTTAVDAFTFDDVTYDFEAKPLRAMTKAECKNGGFRDFQANYKNQGDCVSSVVSNSNQDNDEN